MSSVSGIKAGRAFVQIGADDSELRKKLRDTEKWLNSTGQTIKSIGLKLMASGGAVASSLFLAAAKSGELGSKLSDLSSQTGLSVEALAGLDLAAKSSGSSLDELVAAINRMQRTLSDAASGSKTAAESLAQIGLTIDDLKGLRPEDQFSAIASAISVITDPAKRTTVAMEVFGKSGANLLPVLAQGGSGLRRFRDQSEELGHTLAYKASANVAEFGNAITRTKQQISDLASVIGASIARALQPYEKTVSGILKQTIDWAVANGQITQTVGNLAIQVTAVGAALVGVGAAMKGLAALGGAIGAIAAPEVLAFLTALTVLIVGLTKAIDKLVGGTQEIIPIDFKPVDLEGFNANEVNRKSQISQTDELTSFAQNQHKSQDEVQKAIDTVQQLEQAYGPLGIVIDETTGKVSGLDAGLEELYFRMGKAKEKELEQAMDDVADRIGDIKLKLADDKTLTQEDKERLRNQMDILNKEWSRLSEESSRPELGGRFGKESVFSTEDLPVEKKNESLLPKTREEIEQAKVAVQELRSQFKEMSSNPFEVKTGMDEELSKIDEYAQQRKKLAGDILSKEFVAYGPMGPDNISPWVNYAKRIEQIEKDRIAQVGQAEKQYADTITDYKLQLELELARARGDKQKEAEVRAEQFLRDQIAQIESLGLKGQVKSDAISSAQSIAESMLQVGESIRRRVSGFSQGIFNSNAIASLNRANKSSPGLSELKENVNQNKTIISILQKIADSGGIVFGP